MKVIRWIHQKSTFFFSQYSSATEVIINIFASLALHFLGTSLFTLKLFQTGDSLNIYLQRLNESDDIWMKRRANGANSFFDYSKNVIFGSQMPTNMHWSRIFYGIKTCCEFFQYILIFWPHSTLELLESGANNPTQPPLDSASSTGNVSVA